MLRIDKKVVASAKSDESADIAARLGVDPVLNRMVVW
jgi:hypothetical protein